MKRLYHLLLAVLVCGASNAQTLQRVAYEFGGLPMEGTLALPANASKEQPVPAVLIVPNWMGPGPYSDAMAMELAKRGVAAFVVDMYGVAIRPETVQAAAAAASEINQGDRAAVRDRANRAVDVLRARPEVDKNRIAAIGFSFGGTVVLELARSGTALNGVVSFHGGLDTPLPEENSKIKAPLLILQGAKDPYVPSTEIMKFSAQLRETEVVWTMGMFGQAASAFTNPAANNKGREEFNERAARQAWDMTFDFLAARLNTSFTGSPGREVVEALKLTVAPPADK